MLFPLEPGFGESRTRSFYSESAIVKKFLFLDRVSRKLLREDDARFCEEPYSTT